MQFIKENFLIAVIGALLIFCISVWAAVYANTPSGMLTFAVLDVGQGDALYIEGPTGVQVVIDGGPGSAVLRELPEVMPQFDRSIDAVIETHPDADHIAGFIDLLERYEIGYFIEPGIPKDTVTAQTLERVVSERKISRVLARRGMWLDLGGGAQLHVLFPDFDPSGLSGNKANEGSVVAHLVFGSTSVMLTGDASSAVEGRLLSLGNSDIKSTILKVGHHGSKSSTSGAFVEAVDPVYAVISVGKNSYGHPTERVLEMLESQNIKLFRTDENGTVTCRSNGASFTCAGEL